MYLVRMHEGNCKCERRNGLYCSFTYFATIDMIHFVSSNSASDGS
jgi:hypothetical protein